MKRKFLCLLIIVKFMISKKCMFSNIMNGIIVIVNVLSLTALNKSTLLLCQELILQALNIIKLGDSLL